MLFVSLLFLFAGPATVSGEVTSVRFAPDGGVVQMFVKDERFYLAKNDTKLLWDTGVSLAPITPRQLVGRLADRRAEVHVTLKPGEATVAAEAVFKYLPLEKK